jgi:hypothetical protein
MVERGKGPTESPCSEAKNALVTADWGGGIDAGQRLVGSYRHYMAMGL